MWYETEDEARRVCLEKEKDFKEKFVVLKDSSHPNCWWAQRLSALKDHETN